MRFPDVPFSAAKFSVFEGLGECYGTPYLHMSGRPTWNLVFEAKPGTRYDRFGSARSGEEVLEIAKKIVRETMPWDAPWLESACLADPNGWLVGAITPTVRDPLKQSSSGKRILPLGDAYMSFDPLGAQGANTGNRLAKVLVEQIVAHADAPFDDRWVREIYDAFHARWGAPAMRWTDLLLEPMTLAARYLLLTQLAADGARIGGSSKQELADAFAQNFDDPSVLEGTLRDFSATRRWVAGVLGKRADWEASKGLLAVGARQFRNNLLPR